MLPIVTISRSLLASWVLLWSTSRQDVALHLIGWIIIGSAIAALSRERWLLSFPYVVNFAEDVSSEVLEILPESKVLVSLFSFAICGMAAFFLAGAEHKSKGGSSLRGSWLFFAISRVLLPISGCSFDLAVDPAESALFVLFTVLSLVGPMSSWPSRSFALADAVYTIIVRQTDPVCSGTEAAVVAATLVLAHDAVHTRLLIFLESAALAVAAIFILETTVMVALVREGPQNESWSEALNFFGTTHPEVHLITKAPPALLSAFAMGMFLRTFTQGRVTLKELALSFIAATAFGASVLYSSHEPLELARKPSFACATIVVAMTCASRIASGRKRSLKNNQYIHASGFFSPQDVSIGGESQSMTATGEESEDNNNGGIENSDYFRSAQVMVSDSKMEEIIYSNSDKAAQLLKQDSAMSMFSATSGPQGDQGAAIAAASNGGVANKVVDEHDAIAKEYDREAILLKKYQKRLFYLEALHKGHTSSEEKDSAKAEMVTLKDQVRESSSKLETLRQRLEETLH